MQPANNNVARLFWHTTNYAGRVNTHTALPYALAREIEHRNSKPLEGQDGERLDIRTTGAASRADPALETVEAIDRT
jgi:hypothetical protein